MNRFLIAALALFLFGSTMASQAEEQAPAEPEAVKPVVELQTNVGKIVVELWPKTAPKTVENHVSSVLRKLQLSNRHELTRWAHDRKLI